MSAYQGADPAGVAEGDTGEVQHDVPVSLVEEAVEPGEQSFRAGAGEFPGDRDNGGGRRGLGDRDSKHPAHVPSRTCRKTRSAQRNQVVRSSKGLTATAPAEKIKDVLAATTYHDAAETMAGEMAEPPLFTDIPDHLVSAV